MEDEALAQFASITGTQPEKARQYLSFTDGDVQQAIELFFANEGADLGVPATSNPPISSHAPPVPDPSTRPQASQRARQGSDGIVHIYSDSDSDPDYSTSRTPTLPTRQPAPAGRTASTHQAASRSTPPILQAPNRVDDDEAFARQLQQEMYGEAGVDSAVDPEGVRAPIARTTETLIGPDSFDPDDPEDMNAAVYQQLRARQRPRPRDRPGIFNQSTAGSIWNEDDASSSDNRERLARATAGASETSSKSRTLAEMYRPPYELMSRLPWDQARQQGKEGEKWILVNIQDPSIFDCQILNRDIWKDKSVMETVRENFIFMQYAKDDPRGNQYIQYYFQSRDNQDAYPHIAIVDPRTGEQVKVWSGPPVPKAVDFLSQLHEFLDRYSLNVSAKNPVAKRKPDVKKETQIEKMTEEQMLEMALQNSLAGNSTPLEHDPDDLTRSINPGQSNERDASTEETSLVQDTEQTRPNGASMPPSPFSTISSSEPHTEPASDVPSTRIQFRHPNGRVVRRFALGDPVRRIYEWLKSSPLEGREGVDFELVFMQKNLIDVLDDSIEHAGLKNGTVMLRAVQTKSNVNLAPWSYTHADAYIGVEFMANSSPDKPPNVRLGTLRGFLPLAGDSVSTRGQNLPSLIQSRSSTSLRDVRAYLNQRKSSAYNDDTDEELDVERDGDAQASWKRGHSPASNRYGRPEGKPSNASEVLMTPQMRSMRLIGNSNPSYQWEKYYKSEEELKKMKKPIRKYYERNNRLISSYLYIDRLLDSSLPHSLIQEYNQPVNSDVSIPQTITEETTSPTSDDSDPSVKAIDKPAENGYSTKVRVKRTPKDLYRLPTGEDTPLLSDAAADGPRAADIEFPEDEEASSGSPIVTLAIYINLAANFVLLAGKIAVIVLTSSLSVLASLVDAALDFLSTAIVWTTTKLISRQDAYAYPVGRRRLEPIGVLVFSVIMITSFFQVALECLNRLTSGDHSIVQLGIPSIVIMASTVVIKFFCWLWCRFIKNSSVQALAQDAMTDVVFNIFSIIFPILGFYLRVWWLDALGGLALSFYVIFNWSRTTATHIRHLTGAAASPEDRNILLYLTMRFAKTIKTIQGIQAYHAGDKLNVEVDVVLDEGMTLRDSHDLGESLQYVLESVPSVDRAFVHLDYADWNLPSHMQQQTG
ncbi:MAG: hypothetical protein LQ338_001973 [Usnochroma carphineum]|nr:MAG: hypothetical protein LQ338_001973 [Usnochroma carphineum]